MFLTSSIFDPLFTDKIFENTKFNTKFKYGFVNHFIDKKKVESTKFRTNLTVQSVGIPKLKCDFIKGFAPFSRVWSDSFHAYFDNSTIDRENYLHQDHASNTYCTYYYYVVCVHCGRSILLQTGTNTGHDGQ